MRDFGLDRLLAVLGILLGLGVSAELALALLLGYLCGRLRR